MNEIEVGLVISNLSRYWYTMAIVFVIARFFYFPHKGKIEFLFSYLIMAAIVSMLCILVSRVEISFGFALGIFAIFNVLNFRSTTINPRELTYLFVCTGVAAKNILAPEDMSFLRLLISDASVLIVLALGEFYLFRNGKSSVTIVYTNLELIHPAKRNELENDLHLRYGITGIEDVEVGEINESKKCVKLTLHCKNK